MTSADPTRLVDEVIASVLTATVADCLPIGESAVGELTNTLVELSSKGKRMRAHLLLAAHDAAGGTAHGAAVAVAAALELFQVAALIHDDVLDRSDTRRGIPATHRHIESRHREQRWLGDAARFGEGGAVLAGDLALMASTRALSTAIAALPPAAAHAVGERFAHLASLCTAGQYLDMRLAVQPLATIGNAHEQIVAVMRAKTASYTTEGPLALGAALAGLEQDAVDAWAAAGVPLGIAFQLRDDLLGTLGTSAVTGKPSGDDLTEGKRTVVLITAMDRANAEQKERIERVLGKPDTSTEDVDAATEVLVETGAAAYVEQLIADYAASARTLLGSLTMTQEARHRIEAIVDSAINRTS